MSFLRFNKAFLCFFVRLPFRYDISFFGREGGQPATPWAIFAFPFPTCLNVPVPVQVHTVSGNLNKKLSQKDENQILATPVDKEKISSEPGAAVFFIIIVVDVV